MHNIASATGKVVLRRARVHLNHPQGQAGGLQVPLRWSLENLDLNPSQLPPNAILLVQRLSQSVRVQTGGGLAKVGTLDYLDSQQQTRLRNSLADMISRAVRPRQGRFFGPPPEAVLFQDFSELLASFAIANHEGRVSGQWWWSQVLGLDSHQAIGEFGQSGSKNGSAWVETLMQHAEQISAVFVQLLLWRRSEVLVSALQSISAEQLAGVHRQQLRAVDAAWSDEHPDERPDEYPDKHPDKYPDKYPDKHPDEHPDEHPDKHPDGQEDSTAFGSPARKGETTQPALRIPGQVRTELLKLNDQLGERVGPVLVAALVQFQASALQDQAWQGHWHRIGSRTLLLQAHSGPGAEEENRPETFGHAHRRDAHPDPIMSAASRVSTTEETGSPAQTVESGSQTAASLESDSYASSGESVAEQDSGLQDHGQAVDASDVSKLASEQGASRATQQRPFLIQPTVKPTLARKRVSDLEGGGPESALTRLSAQPNSAQPNLGQPPVDHPQGGLLDREAGQPSKVSAGLPQPGSEDGRAEPDTPAAALQSPSRLASTLLADMDLATDLGGLFYLIRGFQLSLFDMDEALRIPGHSESPCASWSCWARLDWLARGLLDQCAQMQPEFLTEFLPESWQSDPVWRLLAWLDGREDLDSPPPEIDAAVDAGMWDKHWRQWLTQTRSTLSGRLGESESDITALCDLLQVSARVQATRSHVDVHIPLNRVSMAARVTGLDQDPGWYPDFARIIQFHFDHAGPGV